MNTCSKALNYFHVRMKDHPPMAKDDTSIKKYNTTEHLYEKISYKYRTHEH
jgi:hypothetical protein